jgi:hypothetical protein
MSVWGISHSRCECLVGPQICLHRCRPCDLPERGLCSLDKQLAASLTETRVKSCPLQSGVKPVRIPASIDQQRLGSEDVIDHQCLFEVAHVRFVEQRYQRAALDASKQREPSYQPRSQ